MKTLISLSKKIILLSISIISISCKDADLVPLMTTVESQKLSRAFAVSGAYQVGQLLTTNDRAACVISQGGGISKIDNFGYRKTIEDIKLPWIHGFFAQVGISTDWYWTFIIFDNDGRPRVLKIDRSTVVDLSINTKELCFGPNHMFYIERNEKKTGLPSFITFK